MSEVSVGWASATVQELSGAQGLVTDGDWIESKDQAPNGDVRLIQLADIGDGHFRNRSNRFLTSRRATELGCTFLSNGDVLVARMPDPLGRACIFPGVGQKAVTAVDILIWRGAFKDVSEQWLVHFLNSPDIRQKIASNASGTTRQRISGGRLKALALPVPPAAEQRRIVAKIDSLSSKSKRAREHLDHIPRLVEKYKQAVLTAAFSGDLTRGWRQLNAAAQWTDDETRAISKERQDYLSKRRGSRLRELVSILPGAELPKSWLVTHLAGVVDLLAGFAFKSEWYSPVGVLLLRGINVAPGRLDWSNAARLPAHRAVGFGEFLLKAGDIVVAMDRPLISGGFKVAMVERVEEGALLVQRVSRIRPKQQVSGSFLWHFLNSQTFIQHAVGKAAGSDLPHISANDILSAALPLPPLAEQAEISRRLNRAFTWIDRLAAEATSARKLIDRLDQAVLAEAFRGELVPQDPDDEPASVLLERIRAERGAAPAAKPRRGRAKRS